MSYVNTIILISPIFNTIEAYRGMVRHHRHMPKPSYSFLGTTTNSNAAVIGFLVFIILTVYCYALLQISQPIESSLTNSAPVFRPQLTLILSQQRSGSSWLGSIFNSDPEIFYLFEPLHTKIYQSSSLLLSTVDAQVEILHNICTCNFDSEIPSYGVLEHSSVGQRAQTLLYNVDTGYLRDQCLSAKARVAKVVKIADIYTLERLQTKYPGCELDVVHLVRDPRGSVNSRMGTFQRFFPGEVTTTNFTVEDVSRAAGILCEDRTRLVKGLQTFHRARRLLTVKYEDIAEDPITSIKDLFSQLDITFSISVYNYILESSKASSIESGGYDTMKNSRAVYKKWMQTMETSHVQAATVACSELLKTLNYNTTLS
ncbi:carbohydrate sulfotransferase 1-like [Bolinopsis microptera]|uniref:carbohydrate sulfotransferase 1-like n=1 Tax=Bolinopsis microptera TaxID=2820187 RepID=UPI0030793999